MKVSSLFLKLHVFFDRQAKKTNSLKPYILKNEPSVSDIKIIHVIANFIIGGSTQLVVDIIERTSHKYRHKVIVPDYSDPLPYQPVDIHQFSIDEMRKMYEFLEKEKPAIVHIHYYVRESTRFEGKAFWYYGVFKVCEDLGIRVIQNVNVPTSPFISSAVVHNVYVSAYVRDHFNGNNNVRNSVIYPGSDFSHFAFDSAVSNVPDAIGMVYRLDNDKLNEESIDVFLAVVRLKPTVHCYIVGGGLYFDLYKRKVRDAGLEKNFTFTGFVSYKELPKHYQKFSLFVAPVHDESFGQVSPFAMGMGKVIAGYDTGALGEILGYKDTLVPYGNTEELASGIVALLGDPIKMKELARKNQERALETFSVETMIEKYRALYDSYLQ